MNRAKKQFGIYVIEMRKFKKIIGHDDTLPFVAELWANGKHIANCHNDGWGGDTATIPTNIELFNEVAKVVCSTKGAFNEADWNYTMPILADELADKCLFNVTVQKEQKKGLVFMAENGNLITVPFKTKIRSVVPISEMLLTQSGQKLIKETIQKYTNQGMKLLNSNIRYSEVLI